MSSGLADLHMKAPSQELASSGRRSVPLEVKAPNTKTRKHGLAHMSEDWGDPLLHLHQEENTV